MKALDNFCLLFLRKTVEAIAGTSSAGKGRFL
jgi:hypothetical protein